MTQFNMLALIEAGAVKADDDLFAIMQNVNPAHAHMFAKWLVLATETPVHLRLIGLGEIEEIHYTLDQVRTSIQQQ